MHITQIAGFNDSFRSYYTVIHVPCFTTLPASRCTKNRNLAILQELCRTLSRITTGFVKDDACHSERQF